MADEPAVRRSDHLRRADGGMRLWVFLAHDALGTLLWTTLLALGGWELGRRAVHAADLLGRYGRWVTLGLVAVALAAAVARSRG